MSEDRQKPYTDKEEIQHGTGLRYFVRTFDEHINGDELIWHRDKKSRRITVLQGMGWQLQKENKLPEYIEMGKSYFIMKMEYHRLIKGSNNLVLRIEEI